MSKIRSLLLVALLLVALTGSAGCAASQPHPQGGACTVDATAISSVAIVQGNRAGTQQVATRELSCYLNDNPANAVHTVVVISDGSAKDAVWDRRWAPNPDRPVDERSSLHDYLLGLDSALRTPATRPEANTLEAISVAAKAIARDTGRKVLLVNDNLLQTTGRLPFQQGYLYAEPGEIADHIAAGLENAGVDMTGVEVVLMAAGTASGDQPELDTEQRAMLVRIWTALLASRGAKVTESTGRQYESFAAAGLPTVSPVPLKEPLPVQLSTPCTTVLSQNRVGFVPGSAQFLDPDAAHATIASVAAGLKSCQGTVTVTGTTASGGDEAYRARLSEGRARAVRAELAAALGVPESEIQARGIGMRSPYHVPDRLPSGGLDPVKAQANRLVIIQVEPR